MNIRALWTRLRTPVGLRRWELERTCMRNLLGAPAERVFFKDLESRFLLVSRGFCVDQGRGRSVDELLGKTDFDLFGREHALAAFEDEQRVIRTGEPIVAKLEREIFDDGRPDAWVSTTKMPLRDKKGHVIGTFGVSRDVTAQVRAEEALAQQALHDQLTGLANRVTLMDRLSQALVEIERGRGRVGLLFVDLDNFKRANGSVSHEAGDEVLVEVARRLVRACRRGDTVARLGGDEFVVLCRALRDDDDIRLMATRVLRAVGRKFRRDDNDLTVTASIGVVVTADATADPSRLLQDADMAMHEAKGAGGDCFRVFDDVMNARRAPGHGFDADMRRALDKGELFLMYQPLFSLDDGALSGVEALVRWQHPQDGLVLPGRFIPLAEERGLIDEVDDFVLDEACRQLAEWAKREACPATFTVAVNLSGRQLSDPKLAERVRSTITRHGIEPSRICLELTETALVGELGEAARCVTALSRLGVKLALDDFGTGYSTLVHLQLLDTDILKIDRSFVQQIGESGRDHEIIAAITAMAHALGMTVVAEGIETDIQLGELSRLGCDVGQGFLLARPVSPDKVFGHLATFAALQRPAAVGC